uniref:Putative secreted protein n=1 Tax=Anopheles darlingi TaxID=43151 RepID=A0A2M4DCP6_ANODA
MGTALYISLLVSLLFVHLSICDPFELCGYWRSTKDKTDWKGKRLPIRRKKGNIKRCCRAYQLLADQCTRG